jgi:hypothetical protein
MSHFVLFALHLATVRLGGAIANCFLSKHDKSEAMMMYRVLVCGLNNNCKLLCPLYFHMI